MKILFFILFLLYTMSLWGQHQAPAPLFRDPITDGAADPVLIWNRTEKNWWMLYTQRRANSETADVAYCYGNQIGIASSDDHGQSWVYRGTLDLDIDTTHSGHRMSCITTVNTICSYLIFKAYAIIGAGMPVSPTTLVKIYGTGNMQENHRSTPISSILPYTGLPTVLGKCGTKTRTAAL